MAQGIVLAETIHYLYARYTSSPGGYCWCERVSGGAVNAAGRCTLNGCKCPASGTSPYDNHCYISKSCPSGYYLNSTGTSCYKYNYTSYDCPSGFYKINNNNDYCYQ